MKQIETNRNQMKPNEAKGNQRELKEAN